MGTSAPTHKRNIANTPAKINDVPEGNDFHDCPTDQYLCTMCRNVPELVNIFTDIGSVEFKCKEHGTIILTVKQYFEKMRNSEFTYYNFRCSNCHQIQKIILKNLKELKDGIFKFCYICRKIYCQECCTKTNVHPNFHNESCINVNEMNTRCPDIQDVLIILMKVIIQVFVLKIVRMFVKNIQQKNIRDIKLNLSSTLKLN